MYSVLQRWEYPRVCLGRGGGQYGKEVLAMLDKCHKEAAGRCLRAARQTALGRLRKKDPEGLGQGPEEGEPPLGSASRLETGQLIACASVSGAMSGPWRSDRRTHKPDI